MFHPKLNKFFFSGVALSLMASTQLQAAAVLAPQTQPLNVSAPYELSNSSVGSGTTKAYRPWYENGTWQGDLIQYDISSTGLLSTTVDSTVSPPTTTTGGNWSARIQFNAKGATYWDTGRKIIFHDGTNQKAFRWANLNATQQANLISVDYLNYIRGDQSKEIDKTGGTLRQRFNLLGDIVHSNPVYVAAPDSRFNLPGYSSFKTANAPTGQADRAARIYVGANDGMVHAFDAATGDEVWAYIPSMIIDTLDNLAAIPFNHTYYVDGQLNEGDADFDINANTYEWHSLLVGGLGSGGKGLFALDITDANLSAETSNTGKDKKILWELDGSDADIGHIYGKAQIARLPEAHNHKWVVISGNGYGSTNTLAKLLIVDKDGVVTKVSTDSTTSNGLSAPTLVDVDGDFDVDYGYAGDLQGNMWKFDFTTNPVSVSKLFAAGVDKPITIAPDVRRHPSGGYLVYFGTGSLLSSADAQNTTTQSIYGIWDGTNNTQILTQTLATDTYSYDPGTGTTVSVKVRTSTNTVIDWSKHKGWQVDLNISGERLVSAPIIRANRMQFVTHNPTTSVHGDAWLIELNFLNGGTGSDVFLDLNRDGSLSSSDRVNSKIPVGMNLGSGSFSAPRIAQVSAGKDTMFINGLFLALAEPCTINCQSGFQLGHIDVDTDSPYGGKVSATVKDSYCYFKGDRANNPVDASGNQIVPPALPASGDIRNGYTKSGSDGIGWATDGHVHEYDKKHGQVYVDYLDIEPLCSQLAANGTKINKLQKLNRITEADIPYNKEFFVVVSNADLSPGSTLQIGAKKWNIVVYQKMVQEAIRAWRDPAKGNKDPAKFATYMVDYDGDSLIFTIDKIKAAGTFRHQFNDRAIADGGLLPTESGCVKKHPYWNIEDNDSNTSANEITGRWRGGALITQAIDVAQYKLNPDMLIEQKPTDLYRKRIVNGKEVWLKADNDGDGIYETFLAGGLRAQDFDTSVTPNVKFTGAQNPIFLYESTLFWHYSGTCYGTPTWSSDVQAALSASSTSVLNDIVASLEYDLEKAEKILAKLIKNGAAAATINDQKKIIDLLKKRIQEVRGGLSTSGVVSTSTPTPPTDVTPDISPSLGPNFRTGRRTWIDLTP